MTEFATLLHAYGRATDTPAHLAALVGGDAAGRSAALEHLWSAVIHQGTPWTATPPVAVEVAGLVGDPRLAGSELVDVRASLLNFLAAVANAGRCYPDLEELQEMAAAEDVDVDAALSTADEDDIYENEALANALYARSILGCRAIVATLLDAAVAALSDPEPKVRGSAAYAVGACCETLGVAAEAATIGARLEALAERAEPDERAALVTAMGELGLEPRSFLDDPHPGVRACAALAPKLAGDPAATNEILAALADPAAADEWFARRPPQFPMRFRFALVAAAIARVDDPERLLPAALALAPIANVHTVREDWGRLLRAFDPLSPAQRRYLAALVDNADLWDPRNGTAGLVFRDAGLPYDRDECRSLALSV